MKKGGGMEKKRRKIVKGKVEIENGRREKFQNEVRPFFFPFSLFKMTKICFVLGLPKWKFSTGKKHFKPGKKIRKNDFAPSEKFSCYTPATEKIHTARWLSLTSQS